MAGAMSKALGVVLTLKERKKATLKKPSTVLNGTSCTLHQEVGMATKHVGRATKP